MKLQDFFTTGTRPDGETFTLLADNAPDWLRSAVYQAHDGCMPDDVIYDICHRIALALDDGAISLDDEDIGSLSLGHSYTTQEKCDALMGLRMHDVVLDACNSDSGPDHRCLWGRIEACFDAAMWRIGHGFFSQLQSGGHL